jgi:zeaxanthin glucosyltransferase
MRVAFALIPEKGHVNPYVGPAQALQEMGHEVVVGAPGDIGAQCAAAGLPFAMLPGSSDRPTHGAELVALIQDRGRLAAWIGQLLLDNLEEQVVQLRAWYRGMDAVVVDPLYYAASLAAEAEGLPWAAVSNSLNPVIPDDLDSDLLRTVRNLQRPPGRYAGCDRLSPYLNIAFTTEALRGPVEGVHLVGPSFPLRSRGDEAALRPLPEGRPVIYASFGSQIYHWPELFAKLAAANPGAELVLSVGDLPGPFPGCQAYRYAPQLELLKRARVFVTHGGANSFMEAIAANVPMLISPMCNDQFHQAYFTKRSQIGLVTDLRTATVEEIRRDLVSLMGDGPERAAMARLSATYQVDGERAAARLIDGLAL